MQVIRVPKTRGRPAACLAIVLAAACVCADEQPPTTEPTREIVNRIIAPAAKRKRLLPINLGPSIDLNVLRLINIYNDEMDAIIIRIRNILLAGESS